MITTTNLSAKARHPHSASEGEYARLDVTRASHRRIRRYNGVVDGRPSPLPAAPDPGHLPLAHGGCVTRVRWDLLIGEAYLMKDREISVSRSPRPLGEGVGAPDIMGRALAVLRDTHHCSAHEASRRLNTLAADARRDVVVIAAEIVYADSITAARRRA